MITDKNHKFGLFFLVLFLGIGVFFISKDEVTYSSTDFPKSDCDQYIKSNVIEFKNIIEKVVEITKNGDSDKSISYISTKRKFTQEFTSQLMECSASYRFSNYVDYFDIIFQNYILLMHEIIKGENYDFDLVLKYANTIKKSVDVIIRSKIIKSDDEQK